MWVNNIDPIAFQLWVLPIRWYSLAYMAAFVFGSFYVKYADCKYYNCRLAGRGSFLDNMLLCVAFGAIFFGRVGHIILYHPLYFAQNPSEILRIWHGGMSFHGGLVGVILALFFLAKKEFSYSYELTERTKVGDKDFLNVIRRREGGLDKQIAVRNTLHLLDIVAPAAALGIGIGRMANFANGELYGVITAVAWGVVFPHAGGLPRHPTQIYEAIAEGFLLFPMLSYMLSIKRIRDRPGAVSATFALLYGLSRGIIEFFKEPDLSSGYIAGLFTMGQVLCLFVIITGSWIFCRKRDLL